MKRIFCKKDIPDIKSGKLKIFDFKGRELKVYTLDNQLGDTENINIIAINYENLPVSYRFDGICTNELDGEYCGTCLYVEDGKDFRDVTIEEAQKYVQ